jgi:hypothetical protein
MFSAQAVKSFARRFAGVSKSRLFAIGLATLLIGFGVVLFVTEAGAQGPYPNVQTGVPRIIGRWSGKTEEDGILTIIVYPAPGRELSYEFSGGQKEHGEGTFTLRGANELHFTPKGAKEPEKWTYSFDEDGRLHLKMEEDKPEDEEEYILSRAGQ